MEKEECPRCKRQTPKEGQVCIYCGVELAKPKSASEDKETILATIARATSAAQDQKIEIARVSVHPSLPAGFLPGERRLVVPSGRRAVVCADGREPLFVEPGLYSLTRRGTKGGVLNAFLGSLRGGLVTICEVPAAPFLATFVLPDADTLAEYRLVEKGKEGSPSTIKMSKQLEEALTQLAEDTQYREEATVSLAHWRTAMRAALSSQNLRTSDDLLGGVEVQLRLQCEDPVRLEVNLIMSHERFRDHEQKAWSTLQKHERSWLLGRFFANKGLRREVERAGGLAFDFKIADLFGRLRNEFEMAVRAAIRNETAQALYDTTEVRDRVKEDIARAMAHSLDLYGISIDQVVAFQFNCPEYERLRFRRGQTVADRVAVDDLQEQVGIAKKRRGIAAGDLRDAASTEEDLKQHEISETAKTDEARDMAGLEAQRRSTERDAELRDHERTQLEADEQLNIHIEEEKTRRRQQLQQDKIRGLLELQNQQQDAALRRQVEWARTVAELGLTGDSVLAIMLQSNPQLGPVLVEMKRAAGLQEMLTMRAQFEERLVQVLGQDRRQIGRLMDEAVKQFGNVMAKRAEATRPQIVAGGGHLLQLSPPPPPKDVDSREREPNQAGEESEDKS
jgi:hypothetical protein